MLGEDGGIQEKFVAETKMDSENQWIPQNCKGKSF